MNGGQIIAEVLHNQGVRQIFTLCGGHISPILVGCKQRDIKVVDVRDEVTAVFAADSVARLTGVPGVAAVTAGPGVGACRRLLPDQYVREVQVHKFQPARQCPQHLDAKGQAELLAAALGGSEGATVHVLISDHQ